MDIGLSARRAQNDRSNLTTDIQAPNDDRQGPRVCSGIFESDRSNEGFSRQNGCEHTRLRFSSMRCLLIILHNRSNQQQSMRVLKAVFISLCFRSSAAFASPSFGARPRSKLVTIPHSSRDGRPKLDTVVRGMSVSDTISSNLFSLRSGGSASAEIIGSTLFNLRGGGVATSQGHQSILVGNISEFFSALLTRSGGALEGTLNAFDIPELIPILALSFLPEIFLRFVSTRIINKTIRRTNPLEFEDTPYLSKVSQVLCHIGQLAFGVYAGELFLIFLCGLGVPGLNNRSRMLASLVYGYYVAQQARGVKANLVDRALRRYRRSWASRKPLINRVLDAVIYLIATIMFLEFNNIDVGVALKSVLALGGVSSVVAGLALKEPATEIIQGTSLLLSNKFSTGDVIKLSDGTVGQVQDLKWTDSMIRGSDNSFVRIPHTQMAKQRIVNLSRQPSSQVSQKLALPNRGPDQIKKLIEDIKSEIRTHCPMLIEDDDSSARRFLVHWTDIEKDNVIINIESHYRIPRLSKRYWENRQEVLVAISRAVSRYNEKEKEGVTLQ